MQEQKTEILLAELIRKISDIQGSVSGVISAIERLENSFNLHMEHCRDDMADVYERVHSLKNELHSHCAVNSYKSTLESDSYQKGQKDWIKYSVFISGPLGAIVLYLLQKIWGS